VVHEHRHRIQVIDRNVEEALKLMLVKIDPEYPVGARGHDHVRHQLGPDRNAWLVLPILSRIPVIGHDARDPCRRCAPRSVDEQQQLQDVLRWWIRRLNDEDVQAPNVLVDANGDLAIRELAKADLSDLHAKVSGDRLGKGAIGRAGQQLEAVTRNR